MRRICFILLLLLAVSANAQTQSGINWGKYFITGSLSVGQPVNTWASDAALLQMGGDTVTKGFIPARVKDTGLVYFPRPLGTTVWQYKDSAYYFWVGSRWKATGKSTFAISDVIGLQTALDGKAPASGSANYIQNGTTPQPASFNITGNGIFSGGILDFGNRVSSLDGQNPTIKLYSVGGGTVYGFGANVNGFLDYTSAGLGHRFFTGAGGSGTQNVVINGKGISVGAGTGGPVNIDNWNSVIEISGSNSKSLINSTSVAAGTWVHDGGFITSGLNAGRATMALGTTSAHPVSFIVNNTIAASIETDKTLKLNGALSLASNTSDYSGANGFEYYNNSTNKFRDFVAGSWQNRATESWTSTNFIQNQNAAPQSATMSTVWPGTAAHFRTSGAGGQVPLFLSSTDASSFSGLALQASNGSNIGYFLYANPSVSGANADKLILASESKDIVLSKGGINGNDVTIKVSTGDVLIATTSDNGEKAQVNGGLTTNGRLVHSAKQTTTAGTTTTVSSTVRVLYVNPASTLATHTITLPASPLDGQEVLISFGGTLTTGSVVTSLTISPNAGQACLRCNSITSAAAGDGYLFKYESSTGLWRIF